jgi:hypothetical protein
MILEKVTLTTTPKSLYELITEKRALPNPTVHSARGLIIRNTNLLTVLGSDTKTVDPVTLTDSSNEFESHIVTDLHETHLSVDSGTGTVDLVISQ